MSDYQNTATAVRQRPTFDTIMTQVAQLVDQASGLAGEAERIADDLCGETPETSASDGREAGFSGKLDALSKLLDMVSHHQHRARVANRRISGVVLNDDIKQAGTLSGVPSGGQILGAKVDRYC